MDSASMMAQAADQRHRGADLDKVTVENATGLDGAAACRSAPPYTVPIVLCAGFLGPAKDESTDSSSRFYDYWGEATGLSCPDSPILCVWPGGLSSLHDRACEIFYQIKGGVVDYGEQHSRHFGHNRFGRKYAGEYPAWSSHNPIHIVGHSLGGTTARMLQHLLHIDAFPGHKTSADWIVSLTAINAPLNGALAAYALGEEEEAAPKVVSWSPGNLLGAFVHVLAFIDCKFLGFDLGMDHWELSWRGSKTRRQEMSFKSAGKCACQAAKKMASSLFVKSEVVESEDNAAYDASVHAMAKHNKAMGIGHDSTFYISLVGNAADANEMPPCPEKGAYFACSEWLLWVCMMLQFLFRRAFLLLISYITTRRRYTRLATALAHVKGFSVDGLLGESDGLCSLLSQSHPITGIDDWQAWRVQRMPESTAAMRRGVWHVQFHAQDHMGIVPFPISRARQKQIFSDLFARLRSLPLTHEQNGIKLQSAHMCKAQAVGGEDKWCGAGAAPIGPQRSISSDELARMAPLGSGTPKSQCSSTHRAATDGASDEQD